MSELKKRLSDEIKTAMKAGEKERLGYGRNLHAAIRKKEIDDRVDLADDGVLKIISTLVKQRKDSIEQFEKGGRDDLVAAETAELKFLQSFMPEQMSEAEVQKIVDAVFEEVKPSGSKDMGKVMKVLLPKLQGRADGKMVSGLVKSKLG